MCNFKKSQSIQIVNKTNNAIIAGQAKVADTTIKRIVGLLNRKEFSQGEALVINPCSSIHTFFMRFAIDVVFIDRKNKVMRSISNLKPWRLSGICFSAVFCIELPTGTIEKAHINPGDTIYFSPPIS